MDSNPSLRSDLRRKSIEKSPTTTKNRSSPVLTSNNSSLLKKSKNKLLKKKIGISLARLVQNNNEDKNCEGEATSPLMNMKEIKEIQKIDEQLQAIEKWSCHMEKYVGNNTMAIMK